MKIFAPKFQSWIKAYVERHDALSGTVHLFLKERLELGAAIDFPLKMQQSIAKLAVGEGFAGAAMEQGKTLRPTDVEGTELQAGAADGLAIPISDPAGGHRAVVSIFFEQELPAEQVENLELEAQGLPPF
jgi:hypothetical protein